MTSVIEILGQSVYAPQVPGRVRETSKRNDTKKRNASERERGKKKGERQEEREGRVDTRV